jgi:hypothetical protein
MLFGMNETFILSAYNGLLKCDQSAGLSIWIREIADQAQKRAEIESAQVEDRIWGWDGPWDSLVTMMAEHHDLSERLPGVHIWKEREAGLQAVLYALLGIQAGEYDLLLAGGGGAVQEPPQAIQKMYEVAALVLASPALVGRLNLLPSGILTIKTISSSTLNMSEKVADAARQLIQKAGIEPEQLDLVCALNPGLEIPPGLQSQLEEVGFTDNSSLFKLVEVFTRLEKDHKQRALLLGMMGQRTVLAILLERL